LDEKLCRRLHHRDLVLVSDCRVAAERLTLAT
jgi:hypothetical protein